MQTEGVLVSTPALQIGFKGDFRSHAARVGVYYGNMLPGLITGLTVELIVPQATASSLVSTLAPIEKTPV